MPRFAFVARLGAAVMLWTASIGLAAQRHPLGTNEVPYHQSRPPGPALTPEQAMAKMQLPPGFKIECVAHEPDVINPTSFTFDDQGRIWITESIEYPRADAGIEGAREDTGRAGGCRGVPRLHGAAGDAAESGRTADGAGPGTAA